MTATSAISTLAACTEATMTDWISTADTAKCVRRALADAFPGVRFSVRSKVYSGGSSITVHWTDGPSTRDVDSVIGVFAGRDFDGMIDLGIYVDAIVDARGRVIGHKSPGTVGSHGTIPPTDDPVPPGARVVHFGASYVFSSRTISPDVQTAADAILAKRGYDPRAPWDCPLYIRDQAVDAAIAGRL
jgi:hypothetical protein